jgi:DNA helicase-2/ATP-dependent DNA helicase PcrA
MRAVSRFLKALPDLKAAEAAGAVEAQDPGLLPLFARYREMRTDLNFLDLDDLEIETRRLFRSCPEVPGVWGERYPWMFVDEYQDTNAVQVELLKELVRAGARSICAIGDPDQAIYGFRGARVENFLRFGEDFSGAVTIRLTRSYRSTGPILQCAASVLEKDNPLEPDSPGGVPLFLARCGTGKEEAEMIVEQVERLLGGTSYFSLDSGRVDSTETGAELGFGDLAVLYRLNAQGESVAEALDRAGIPFVRSGEAPLAARYPANLFRRFLQTFRYPENAYFRGLYEDMASEEGVLLPAFAPDFGPDGPLLEIVERAAAYHALNDLADDAGEVLKSFRHTAASFGGGLDAFLDYLSLERGIDHALLGGERVALMSLHAAKGLEWPVVFIIGCEDGLIPCTLFGARDADEERRLLYVGMTRACRRLILSHAMKRSLDGRPLQLAPSPFLNLLPPHLTQPLERRVWKPKRPAHEQLSLFE